MNQARAHCAILPDRGVVAVSGSDAVTFLDNLVTNSLDKLEDGDARFSALLTPQGKILFEFLAVRTAEGFILDTRREKVADLVKRLTMYRLRAKVDIKDLSSDTAVAAVWWTPLGSQPTSFTYEADVLATFADPRDPRLGLRIIARKTSDTSPIRHLDGAVMSNEASYHATRIAAGIGEGGYDYPLGDTYPHEASYDLTNGVSFTKGCYVGQEVVSRMQNKTVVRKRVVHIEGSALASGAEVKVGDAAIGTVGSTYGTSALALVRLDRVAEALDKSQPLTVRGAYVSIDPAAIARYRESVANKPVIDL